ncbi:hypothetical protein ACFL1N_01895 [Thermodesulfobacteriota bacterium]
MKKIKIFLITLLASLVLLGVPGASSAYDPLDISGLNESNLTLSIGSRPGYSDFSYGTSIDSLLLEKEYNTYLPWMDETQFKVRFVIDPNLWSRPGREISRVDSQVSGLRHSLLADANFLNLNPASFDASFNPDDFGYGLQISTLFFDSSVDLYFWTGSENSLFTSLSASRITSPSQLWGRTSALFHLDNSEYYFRNKNVAATWSKDLSFLGFIHQGTAPTIRLETSYRSDEVKAVYAAPGVINRLGGYDELSFGIAYEGKNNFELLNSSYGINWGFGYSYSRALNVPEIIADTSLENFDTRLGTHSGNINASTSWKNMKLMTMVMYLYDIQSKGGITMMQANFSPDLRWTYGVRANFYDGAESALWPWIEESEHISLSVTYKW